MRLASIVKNALFTRGEAPREIRSGVLRGLKFNLDPENRAQVIVGLGEREIQGWFARLSGGLASAIDVGGAEGFYTVYFLKKTPARRVIVFEPEPSQLEILRGNLRLNGVEGDARLEVHGSFVGDRDGEGWRSLDSMRAEIETPCVVKVDVEGGEVGVLHGASELLKRPGVSWIIETHSAELERECIRILREAGYGARVVDKAWWRIFLPETRSSEHNRWLIATRS